MALLDGDTQVLVYPEVESVDDYGNTVRVPGVIPVTVWALCQPSSTEEYVAYGDGVSEVSRILCREFPAGPWGKVTFDGRDWDVVGAPKPHRSFALTSHDTAVVKSRSPRGI